MEVALLGRLLAAVAGGLLVLTVWGSVIGTLIVPRPVGSWLTRWVDRFVNGAFSLATSTIADYRRRDRVLLGQAAAILLVQLAAWLGVSFLGYGLLLWPVTGGLGSAFTEAGSSLFTLGFAEPAGAPSAASRWTLTGNICGPSCAATRTGRDASALSAWIRTKIRS